MTLFERDERIGGRAAIVHPYFDEKLPAIELGASIFADVNKNLKRAAEVIHLLPTNTGMIADVDIDRTSISRRKPSLVIKGQLACGMGSNFSSKG